MIVCFASVVAALFSALPAAKAHPADWHHLQVKAKATHAPRLFEQALASPETDELQSVCAQPSNDPNKFLVYYAAYGSNISLERMRAYFLGGRSKGLLRDQQRATDPTPPSRSDIVFLTGFPLFGEHQTSNWGEGSVVFLDTRPSSGSDRRESLLRLYRMTLTQFTDLFLQENNKKLEDTNTRAQANLNAQSVCALAAASRGNPDIGMEWSLGGWYSKIVVLAEHHGLPVLTFTCSDAKRADYEADQKDKCNMPANAYRQTIVRGLVECGQSAPWANEYIDRASCNALVPGAVKAL